MTNMPSKRAQPEPRKSARPPAPVLRQVLSCLETYQGVAPVAIDLRGRAPFADYMVIVSGRNHRHMEALLRELRAQLKRAGHAVRAEGASDSGWRVLDAGELVVHVFHPEQRRYYALEEMWQPDLL